jgi:hypothetical protein
LGSAAAGVTDVVSSQVSSAAFYGMTPDKGRFLKNNAKRLHVKRTAPSTGVNGGEIAKEARQKCRSIRCCNEISIDSIVLV